MKNKLLKKLLLPLALLLGSFIYAQSVTGTVSDASGPLPGVNVLVKGTSTGTVTDFDGNFTIAADSGTTLVFSFIGYLTQEIVVSGATVNVLLEEDAVPHCCVCWVLLCWVVDDDERCCDDGVEEKAFAPEERAKIVARTEDF